MAEEAFSVAASKPLAVERKRPPRLRSNAAYREPETSLVDAAGRSRPLLRIRCDPRSPLDVDRANR